MKEFSLLNVISRRFTRANECVWGGGGGTPPTKGPSYIHKNVTWKEETF